MANSLAQLRQLLKKTASTLTIRKQTVSLGTRRHVPSHWLRRSGVTVPNISV